jgi:hypothetical protein
MQIIAYVPDVNWLRNGVAFDPKPFHSSYIKYLNVGANPGELYHRLPMQRKAINRLQLHGFSRFFDNCA